MRKEETVTLALLHRAVPAKHTDEGLRALSGESPIRPESVQKYLESKFGEALEDVSNAMLELAKSLPPSDLAEKAYALYDKFRPEIPPGKKGWGASGKLDLDLIRKMASACPWGRFFYSPEHRPKCSIYRFSGQPWFHYGLTTPEKGGKPPHF